MSKKSRRKTKAPKRSYGLFNFAFDLILCFITGGLWLLWIFVREMRRR